MELNFTSLYNASRQINRVKAQKNYEITEAKHIAWSLDPCHKKTYKGMYQQIICMKSLNGDAYILHPEFNSNIKIHGLPAIAVHPDMFTAKKMQRTKFREPITVITKNKKKSTKVSKTAIYRTIEKIGTNNIKSMSQEYMPEYNTIVTVFTKISGDKELLYNKRALSRDEKEFEAAIELAKTLKSNTFKRVRFHNKPSDYLACNKGGTLYIMSDNSEKIRKPDEIISGFAAIRIYDKN